MTESVLITGCNGFIGGAIAKTMKKEGYATIGVDKVSIFDAGFKRDTTDIDIFLKYDTSDARLYTAINKLSDKLDFIFHFGTPSSAKLYDARPKTCYLETTISQYYIMKLAEERQPNKLIFPSSSTVYAGVHGAHNETCYPIPKTLYAAAKMAVEGIAHQSLFKKWNALRIFAGYGNGEEHKKNISSPICQILTSLISGRAPIIYGDGSQTRDFAYIEDITRIIRILMDDEYNGILNIGSGQETNFNKLVEIANSFFPSEQRLKATHIQKPMKYPEKLYCNMTKQKQLSGEPQYKIEDGILKFKKHLELNRGITWY